MTKRRFITIAVGVLSFFVASYFVGWHTFLGRAVRGMSTVAVVNRTATALQSVGLSLTDSRGRQIDRRFENLQPRHTVRIGVRTSDLIVWRIVCEQGRRAFTNDVGVNVTPGEVYVVAVDSPGSISGEYER
jgi:hypothetical protein